MATEVDPSWNIKVSMVTSAVSSRNTNGLMPQITLIEPGVFRTGFVSKAAWLPLHPAYTKPDGVAAQTRELITTDTQPIRVDAASGDTAKAARKIYELSLLPSPPMRLAMGRDALTNIRRQIQMVTDDIDKYETWSKDLLED